MAQVILPPNALRLHQTPGDMEMGAILNRMYGGYNVRPGWMYPESPYARARTGIRGLRGLGFDYWDLKAQAGFEDCDPKDSACTARNAERSNAVEDLWVSQYMSNPNTANMPVPQIKVNLDTSAQAYQQYMANQPLTGESITAGGTTYGDRALEQGPFYIQTGGGTPVRTGGRVQFQTSTGDTTQLKPGDTWTITITGATPSSPVTVTGGQNGQVNTTPMGTTDSGGNWKASGAVDTSMIGSWQEAWAVGGLSSGSFGFNVVAATQAQQSAATGKPNAGVPPSNPLVPGDTGFDSTGKKLAGQGSGDGSGAAAPDNSMLLWAALGVGALLLLTRR